MAKGRKTGGRKAGTPNKSTMQSRDAIAEFIDGNIDKLDDWLNKIEEENGALAAFKCFTAMLEYNVPKMQRMEVTGEAVQNPIQDMLAWIAERDDGGLPNKKRPN